MQNQVTYNKVPLHGINAEKIILASSYIKPSFL